MGMNSPCVNCGADSKVCKECGWYNGVWIPKDQYEAKLKANMVAMLKELQTEIEELEKPHCHNASHADGCVSKWRVEGVIQQKIDKMRGEESG